MEFSIKAGTPDKLRSGCIAVGVFDAKQLTPPAAALDKASSGYLSEILRRGDLEAKAGATLLLHNVPGTACERVLLVSLGKQAEFSDKKFRSAVGAAAKALATCGSKDAVVCLLDRLVAARDARWHGRQAAMLLADSSYRFEATKSRKQDEHDRPRGPSKITLLVADKSDVSDVRSGADQGSAIASGMALAKELGNLPANICTPTYLAQQARALGKAHKFKVEVLERAQMEKLGMGSLLSVAAGSAEPPKFIVMKYQGTTKKGARPVVLVGKGITFDTGGISIKPAAEMDEMKYDMCGAASVFGTLKAVATLGLPLDVIGIVPSTENMPGGRATKPGDIVTSMSGQTIEILNTDAEGRLILCDALTYAERFDPDCVIDIATLTGACIIALGAIPSGLLANDDDLAAELLARGQDSGDRAWQLPLWDDYQEMLKSNFADIPNIGSKGAGTITAACFLARFTKKYKWAHLDIAGTAWKSGSEKGATGRPVPLLTQFLLARARLA
ncbi:MAG: leucyl aminopeptidase [Sterolibacteriaceae bacterium]|uniref:Probable cytosol aminopeptidase n=1 Tax=Candidatus Methylophosphatis roskildensis TaxID=2899263 RepID=A0A9D7E257_9PROT|nr:leucyl aminopeptidase [Candidatus Methylophosphatis roskildensis]MBK7237166.1 leucyl aminopeptidase [Sterolibacteriaceae bacterium]